MIIKIAERIKELRLKRNLSQKELAKAFKVSRASINAWEIGLSIPSSKRILDIAMYFNVSIDYLFGTEDDLKINISNLDENEKSIILNLLFILKNQKGN